MSNEELERKKKYDEMLEQYVRLIELGEDDNEDDSAYTKRIAESMVSLGVAMVDFEKPEEATKNFINFMLFQIHTAIMEIINQCYHGNPTGETSVGHFDKKGYMEWRKDNEL